MVIALYSEKSDSLAVHLTIIHFGKKTNFGKIDFEKMYFGKIHFGNVSRKLLVIAFRKYIGPVVHNPETPTQWESESATDERTHWELG